MLHPGARRIDTYLPTTRRSHHNRCIALPHKANGRLLVVVILRGWLLREHLLELGERVVSSAEKVKWLRHYTKADADLVKSIIFY